MTTKPKTLLLAICNTLNCTVKYNYIIFKQALPQYLNNTKCTATKVLTVFHVTKQQQPYISLYCTKLKIPGGPLICFL